MNNNTSSKPRVRVEARGQLDPYTLRLRPEYRVWVNDVLTIDDWFNLCFTFDSGKHASRSAVRLWEVGLKATNELDLYHRTNYFS